MANEMTLSKSKINTFIECPRKFKYRYIDEITEEANKYMLLGTEVHEIAEEIAIELMEGNEIEDVFLNKDGLASNGTLTLVSDDNEVEKYVNELKKITGQKEIDMDRPGIFTGDKDIYKGSIFIPIIGDLVDAVSATGGLKAGIYDDLRSKYETRNYNKAP